MSQENVEIVRRWWDGFNKTGMPPLSLCDERIEIRNPPDFPVRGAFHGHQGVRDWRDQVFEAFDNPSVEAEEIIDVTADQQETVGDSARMAFRLSVEDGSGGGTDRDSRQPAARRARLARQGHGRRLPR